MFDSLSYGDEELQVLLKTEVVDSFREHLQSESYNPEACGVLVGSTSIDFESYTVESISPPLPKDLRGRTFFFLKDKGHQKFVNQLFKESEGTQRLLGAWHTHPEKNPSPSSSDYKGWNKLIKKNPDFSPLIFVIVGTSNMSLFTKRGKKFIKLSPIKRI